MWQSGEMTACAVTMAAAEGQRKHSLTLHRLMLRCCTGCSTLARVDAWLDIYCCSFALYRFLYPSRTFRIDAALNSDLPYRRDDATSWLRDAST